MALPMDEQRILDEIERLLVADDPRFAARLASFGRPSVRGLLRTKRARVLVSVMALAVVAVIVVVFYAMSTVAVMQDPPRHPTGGKAPAVLTPQASSTGVVRHAQLPATGAGLRP